MSISRISNNWPGRKAGRAQRYFPGESEMARLMREMDWSSTPLGPVECWPQPLRTTVSTSLDCAFPIVMWWGPELVMLYNDEYRPMLGPEKHPRALGQRGAEVWAEIWDVIDPMLSQVLHRGESTRSRDLLLHINRRGYPEEAYFSFSYSPILGEDGKVGGIFCPVIETTEKVIGERRLRTLRDLAAECKGARREEFVYRAAAEVLAANPRDIPFAMIYGIDENQSVAVLQATAGIPRGAAAAPPAVELRKEAPGVWALGSVAHSGQTVEVGDLASKFDELPTGAWKVPAKSALVLPVLLPGQERPRAIIVAGVSPMRALDDDYGTFFELVATQIASGLADAQALEEERRRAEALAEIDRAKTAFFSNVSHEFRTPLTLMLGPLEDILQDADESLPPPVIEKLNVAHRNSLRLLKLVNTLLDFSRIEAGRIDASYEATDLFGFTAELASNFRSAIERAGLRLVVDCPPLAETGVFVDRDMWEKIVLNLISNAFKFTFDGEIRVALEHRGDLVLLTVADTGIGIPEPDLPKVFQRFHRVRNARSRTHEGTGIGLALVQELVHLHGGDVTVQSREGQGTTFTVGIKTGRDHLPADRIGAARNLASTGVRARQFVEEALRWLPQEEELAETNEPGVSARVLVVDDNADMREYVSRLLLRHYEVDSASDGEEALARIRANPPDLVLTDVMMPRLDGFGLLAAIRSSERTRSLPVIMLSARAGEKARIEGLEAAADDYLTKPFSARELLARVASQLQLSHMRRDSDRRKDEFLTTLAHELRGPLAPVQNMLEVLKRSGSKNEQVRIATDIMERQLGQLTRLVDDLIDVSRITRNSIELRRNRVELSAIVHHAVETCSPLIERLGHRINVDLPTEPIYLTADSARLSQVISNLISNSCKYTEPFGHIWLKTERQGNEAVITVRDTGIGIPANSLDRVFELFAQIDGTLERTQGGLGIGLMLVKRLVEMHGGTVTAHSEGVAGKGSEFIVRLPALAQDSPGISPSSLPDKRIRSGKGSTSRRILVVDDNRDSAQSLAMLLELSGNQTQVAHDGEEALERANTYLPEIILLDIGLPKMNGYDTCRALRKQAGDAKVLIIAMTGWGQPEDRVKSKDAGFDAHLVKPVDHDGLMKLLD